MHLELAAAQEGWYAYRKPYRDNRLILPAEDLPKLEALKEDPIAWALHRTANNNPPKDPSSLNLVIVRLVVENLPTAEPWEHTLLILLAGCATLLTAIFATGTFHQALNKLNDNRDP